MLIPFGVLSAAGAGGVAGDYELIESVILGSAQSSITFSSLATYASDYKHLQIRSVERQSNAVLESRGLVTINGTAGTRTHYLVGTGTSVSSPDEGAGVGLPFYSLGASADANNFTARVVDVLDAYSTTKNKTIRGLFGFANPSMNRIGLQSGFLDSTTAISSITYTSAANYVAGSRFSIYGVRG
jgi:hypothetical protein